MPRRSLRSSLANNLQDGALKVPNSGASKAVGKSTPRKSPHFTKKQAAEEPQPENITSSSESASEAADEEASGYEDEDQSAVSSSPESEIEQDMYASEESGPARKKRKANQTAKGTTATKGKELWREGVKTGLGPGKQVIIAKPRARPAGKIPYAHNYIHPNTMLFLRDLAANNDREWLKSMSDVVTWSVMC